MEEVYRGIHGTTASSYSAMNLSLIAVHVKPGQLNTGLGEA